MEKMMKISASAYRVLLLLQKLNEKDCDINWINNFFQTDPYVARLFSKDVIIKYINTLRLCGYDISRPDNANNYCYKLTNAPIEIDFTDEELKTIAMLKRYSESLHQERIIGDFASFVEKLKRYMSLEQKDQLEFYYNNYDEGDIDNFSRFDEYSGLIKKIETYIRENQRVELKYKLPEQESEKVDIMELQCLKYDPDDVSLICYNLVSNHVNFIKISSIIDIKQLPVVSKSTKLYCPVIFKVKGKLAKVYRAYENEKLTEPDAKGHMTVTAYSCDVDLLLKRLLRYGENCEVLYPNTLRNKMINIIKDAINNYS